MKEFWRKWLSAAAGITALTGLAFAAVVAVRATSVSDALFDFVFLPGELETAGGDIASFAIGVAGAVMVGWAATLLVLLRSPATAGAPETWRALAFGLVAWFVVDGIVSVAAGAIVNLGLNAFFVGMFAPPLIATRPRRT